MRKIFKYVSVCLLSWLILPTVILAASETSDLLTNVGAGGKGPYQPITTGTNDMASIVGTVVETFLGLLGVIFLAYMIYAGYNWMIAQGDEEKVTRAKDTIQRAIIGLIITIGAYAISSWVISKLITETNIVN